MADEKRTRLKLEEFVDKVLGEVPNLNFSEMAQLAKASQSGRHPRMFASLRIELMGARWWFVSQALFAALTKRGHVRPKLALKAIQRFYQKREKALQEIKVDFSGRAEAYDRAMQDDLEDGKGHTALQQCFLGFVGFEGQELKGLFTQSLSTMVSRLTMAVERFEIVDE